MAIASYNRVTYVPEAPSSCGLFAPLSFWKVLRHHPRFLAVFPAPTSTRPARPSSYVGFDGVPGARPTIRGDGTRRSSPSSAGGGGSSTEKEKSAGHAPVAVGLPGSMPTGSKRTKDRAGIFAASASVSKRVKELTLASSSKSQTLQKYGTCYVSKRALCVTRRWRGLPAAHGGANVLLEDRGGPGGRRPPGAGRR